MKTYMKTYIKTLLPIHIILFTSCNINSVNSQPKDLNQLEQMWAKGDYENVLPELLIFRDNNPGSRNPSLDFMIATSYCLFGDEDIKARGCNIWFPRLLEYNLDFNQRNVINSTKQKLCENQQLANSEDLIATNYVIGRQTRSAGVGGDLKHYHSTELSIASKPIIQNREISKEIYENRLIKKEDVDSAALITMQEYDYASKNFCFKSSSGHSSAQLKKMADQLEKVYSFFISTFQFNEPQFYITINIVKSNNIDQIADELYGITLPVGSIGYSNHSDWSILGNIRQNSIATGTLKHELFHLLVDYNFGDIPVWFEEGLASLYEESKFYGDTLKGYPGWRGDILGIFWDHRPAIKELIQMDPITFNAYSDIDYTEKKNEEYLLENEHKQAVNHAMARYFMIYLQNTHFNKLMELYNTLRFRESENIKSPPEDDIIIVFNDIFHDNLDIMDQDFANWFNNLR